MPVTIPVTYRIPAGYRQSFYLSEPASGYSVHILAHESTGITMHVEGDPTRGGRTLADQWIIAAMGQVQQECVSLNLYQGCE
jgi:hypothetical protein